MRRFFGWTEQPVTAPPDRLDFLNKLLDRNGRWIEVADLKAGVVIVFTTALLKELVAPLLRTASSVLSRPFPDFPGALIPLAFTVLLGLLTAASLHALVLAFLTLFPKISRAAERGSVFFGDISALDLECFKQRILTKPSEAISQDLAEQIHTTARLAGRKYQRVTRSLRSLFVTIVVGLLTYAFSLTIP